VSRDPGLIRQFFVPNTLSLSSGIIYSVFVEPEWSRAKYRWPSPAHS